MFYIILQKNTLFYNILEYFTVFNSILHIFTIFYSNFRVILQKIHGGRGCGDYQVASSPAWGITANMGGDDKTVVSLAIRNLD